MAPPVTIPACSVLTLDNLAATSTFTGFSPVSTGSGGALEGLWSPHGVREMIETPPVCRAEQYVVASSPSRDANSGGLAGSSQNLVQTMVHTRPVTSVIGGESVVTQAFPTGPASTATEDRPPMSGDGSGGTV